MANPNPAHKFPKGNTFGGRTPKVQEVQDFCREQSASILQTLLDMFENKYTAANVRLEIAKLLLAYGYGKPSQKLEVAVPAAQDIANEDDFAKRVRKDPVASRLAVELISRVSCNQQEEN
jgi:hypothetical protein